MVMGEKKKKETTQKMNGHANDDVLRESIFLVNKDDDQ
jgi:hypothetical protein